MSNKTINGKPFIADPPIFRPHPSNSTDHTWSRVAIFRELELNPPTCDARYLEDSYLEIRGVDCNTVEIKLAGQQFCLSGITLSNLMDQKMRGYKP